MIAIPVPIVDRIIRHGKEELPNEACGYLASHDGRIRKIYPLTNADHSPEHFSFDPEEQFATITRAREEGYELAAVYHSHPATPARMSAEDIRMANDPSLTYLIYSFQNRELKAFRVNEKKRVREVPVEKVEND